MGPCAVAVFLATWGAACIELPAVSPTPDPSVNGVRQPFSFNLTLARHVDQPFSEPDVDDIFDIASRVLQRRDFECPDVACPVTFARLGDLTTFDTGTSIITSEAQLDAVFSEPQDIKIVTMMVGVCGVPNNNDMTTILGCASTGGTAVLIATADPDVWAHEWGHVQGLRHRDDCPRNLMHSFEVLTNAVNGAECEAFLSPTPKLRLLAKTDEMVAIDDPVLDLTTAYDIRPESWISDWALRRYRSGLPSSCVCPAGSSLPAKTLLEHLTPDLPPTHCANLVRALGLIGDPVACIPLMSRVDTMQGALSVDEFSVLAESLLALGRLASADDTGSAAQYLCEASVPNFWTRRQCELDVSDGDVRNVAPDLARVAVAALGLCDHPLARQRLIELSLHAEQGRFADPWMADQVAEAMSRSAGRLLELRTEPRLARYR